MPRSPIDKDSLNIHSDDKWSNILKTIGKAGLQSKLRGKCD